MKKLIYISHICAAISLLLTACGYHFSGGGQLPQNVHRICVQIFENRTNETGLEQTIANEIIYYFTRFKNVQLTDKKNAQAILSGVIKSSSISTIAHKTSYVTSERRIKIVMDVKLTSTDGKVMWDSGQISDDEAFEFSTDKMQTEENKKSALATLSQRIAERIYYQLTDNF